MTNQQETIAAQSDHSPLAASECTAGFGRNEMPGNWRECSLLLPPMPALREKQILPPSRTFLAGQKCIIEKEPICFSEMSYRFEGGCDDAGQEHIPALRQWWQFLGLLLAEPGSFTYQLQYIKTHSAHTLPIVRFVVSHVNSNTSDGKKALRQWHASMAAHISKLPNTFSLVPDNSITYNGSAAPEYWSNIGEFFPRERKTNAGNYAFHPWRTRPEDMGIILETLSAFPEPVMFSTTLKPVNITEKERVYLFAHDYEDHRFLHGSGRVFEMRTHLATATAFTASLIHTIGITIAGQEGIMINAEEGPVDQRMQDRGGFTFEEAVSDFEVQAASCNLQGGAFVAWEQSIAPTSLQRVRSLVSPYRATSFRPPMASAWKRMGIDIPYMKPPVLSDLPRDGATLGYITHCGARADILQSEQDAFMHTYLVGKTGTGKSTLLLNLALQRIQEGHGVTLVDPHGDLAWDLLPHIPLHRRNDIIIFDPTDVHHPIGFNPVEVDPAHPEQKTLLINELLETFNLLYDMRQVGGPIFELYFRNSLLTLMESGRPYDITMIPRVLSDDDFRNSLLETCKNPLVVRFWKDEAEKITGYDTASLRNITPYITSKINAFIYNDFIYPIVTRQKSAFSFSDILAQKKILIIRLSKGRLGKGNTYLLGSLLVSKLFLAAMARADMPREDRTRHYLFLDEFHNLTTPTVADMLAEARKFGLAVVLANQHLEQIQPGIRASILGNVGTQISFRLGALDAALMAKSIGNPSISDALINLPNYQAIVRLSKDGRGLTPFQMRTLPPAVPPNLNRRKAYIELSRNTYSRSDKHPRNDTAVAPKRNAVL